MAWLVVVSDGEDDLNIDKNWSISVCMCSVVVFVTLPPPPLSLFGKGGEPEG
jgi:hypothetical protein